MKTGKAHGYDGIGAEFYNLTSEDLIPILHLLFNKNFDSGSFPEMWRDSLIVPIHKAGSRDDPSNYRRVSLINVMYKIFSNIVNERLCTWAEAYGKIDEAQAGFRAGYSNIDNMFSLQSMFQKYKCKPGGRFYVL